MKISKADEEVRTKTLAAGRGKRWRAERVLEEMDRCFPDPVVPLQHKDAFTLLIAVLLSAQCTDERVNQVTPLLFAMADTPEAMAVLDVERILAVIRPCGLGPAKAKAISALSAILVERYRDPVTGCAQVPADLAALETLPGVGHKTAQVVMAQAFGVPSFPVDTHIHRLAQRWGLTDGRSVVQTEKDLKRLFPRERWNRLHLQIIYYGRSQCRARTVCDGSNTACGLCPQFNAWRKRPLVVRKP